MFGVEPLLHQGSWLRAGAELPRGGDDAIDPGQVAWGCDNVDPRYLEGR